MEKRRYLGGTEVDLNGTGAKLNIAVPCKCRFVRFELLIRGSDANVANIALDQVKSGSGTSAAALIVKPAADESNKVLYDDTLRNVVYNPGDSFTVNVTAESLNGATLAIPYLVVEEIPEEDANLSALVSA